MNFWKFLSIVVAVMMVACGGGSTTTDLMRAASSGNTETVQALVAAGADANARTGDTFTALMVAVRKGHMETVQALGRGSEPPAFGSAGGTVLRTYGIGAQILQDLGVSRMRVLSAPKQMFGISAFGLEVTDYVD